MIKLLDTSSLLAIIFEAKFPQALKIIADEGYKIIITKEVYNEIRDISIIAELLKHEKIDLMPKRELAEINRIKSKFPSFHDGEISILLIAEELEKEGKKCRCIIDEIDAKKYAKSKNMRVNGVIGLFLWMKSIGKLDKSTCLAIYSGLSNNPRLPLELLDGMIK